VNCMVCEFHVIKPQPGRLLRYAIFLHGFSLPSDPVLSLIVLYILELSLSAGSLQLEHSRDLEHKRRDFTSCGNKKLYFDTHALVCLLEENGNPFVGHVEKLGKTLSARDLI